MYVFRAEKLGRRLGIDVTTTCFFDRKRSVPEMKGTVNACFLLLPSTRKVCAADKGQDRRTGEFARLRACVFLNAAMDCFWEESSPMLSPLCRGSGLKEMLIRK